MSLGRVLAVAASIAALMGLAACGEQTNAASVTPTKMPSVTCLALDKAKDALESADLEGKDVKTEDRKEDRSVWVDSNWIVVDQQPSPDSELASDTKAVLGVVKKGEQECAATSTTVTTVTTTVPTTAPPVTSADSAPATAAVAPATTSVKVPETSPPTTTATTQKATTTSPPTTSASSNSGGAVTPGAFCSSEGATGYTSKGTLMRCSYKAGDERLRWRAA